MRLLLHQRRQKTQFYFDSESTCTKYFLNRDLVRLVLSEQKKFFLFIFFRLIIVLFPPLSNLIWLDVVLLCSCAQVSRISCFGYSKISSLLETDKYLHTIVRGSCGNFQFNVSLFTRTKSWWYVLLFRLLTASNRGSTLLMIMGSSSRKNMVVDARDMQDPECFGEAGFLECSIRV